MKAIVYHDYGSPDVLALEEVKQPSPGEHEVLVKVHAASVNAADWHLMRGDPFVARLAFGLFKPKFRILGADIAGRVEAVGDRVTGFQPGDEVFGDVSGHRWGAFSEYVCAREQGLALKPPNLSFEEAAAAPLAGLTALQALRTRGRIQPGHKVLIHGASGGVGTFAVQIAKSFGAEVTALCSTRNLEMARTLGAHHVIDYTQEDFTQNGQHYDLILGANGDRSIFEFKDALTPKGIYVLVGGSGNAMFQALFLGPWISMTGSRKMGSMLMKPNKQDLLVLRELLEAGKVVPVIDRRYPLSEVPDAIRYLEEGHARGKVVITM